MLADVVAYLRCPVCADGLALDGAALRCPRGHSFDVARQGYVNLLIGTAPAGADTAAMVAARAELFAAGHFDALITAVADAAASAVTHAAASTATAAVAGAAVAGTDVGAERGGLVIDVGAGTGHYLGAVLDRLPGHRGLALDIAKPAARRAAGAHPRVAAAVCDVWRGLPVADGCADLVLDVFAPRNPAEFHRVLRPDGALVVVTPRPDHFAELVGPLGLLGIEPGKDDRLDAAVGGHFQRLARSTYGRRLRLGHADVRHLAGMGPTAFHASPQALAERIAALPEPVDVTVSVQVQVFRPIPR